MATTPSTPETPNPASLHQPLPELPQSKLDRPAAPLYGQFANADAHGMILLQEILLDAGAARQEAHGFRAAMEKAALTVRRLLALRLFIAIVAIANLPLFLMSDGWFAYAVALSVVVAVHAAVSWLNRHEARLKLRGSQDVVKLRERSDNYRKVRDAVKHVIDVPARMNEALYLDLLAGKRIAVNVAAGIVALLDTSDDASWKVRIVRELAV